MGRRNADLPIRGPIQSCHRIRRGLRRRRLGGLRRASDWFSRSRRGRGRLLLSRGGLRRGLKRDLGPAGGNRLALQFGLGVRGPNRLPSWGGGFCGDRCAWLGRLGDHGLRRGRHGRLCRRRDGTRRGRLHRALLRNRGGAWGLRKRLLRGCGRRLRRVGRSLRLPLGLSCRGLGQRIGLWRNRGRGDRLLGLGRLSGDRLLFGRLGGHDDRGGIGCRGRRNGERCRNRPRNRPPGRAPLSGARIDGVLLIFGRRFPASLWCRGVQGAQEPQPHDERRAGFVFGRQVRGRGGRLAVNFGNRRGDRIRLLLIGGRLSLAGYDVDTIRLASRGDGVRLSRGQWRIEIQAGGEFRRNRIGLTFGIRNQWQGLLCAQRQRGHLFVESLGRR